MNFYWATRSRIVEKFGYYLGRGCFAFLKVKTCLLCWGDMSIWVWRYEFTFFLIIYLTSGEKVPSFSSSSKAWLTLLIGLLFWSNFIAIYLISICLIRTINLSNYYFLFIFLLNLLFDDFMVKFPSQLCNNLLQIDLFFFSHHGVSPIET